MALRRKRFTSVAMTSPIKAMKSIFPIELRSFFVV